MQKAVLEGRLQWGTALSRITRYKDTVRWRAPLELRLSLTLGLGLSLTHRRLALSRCDGGRCSS